MIDALVTFGLASYVAALGVLAWHAIDAPPRPRRRVSTALACHAAAVAAIVRRSW